MSTSVVVRAILAATALAIAPVTARAQAPTKSCKDGTTSTRSTFACWGHGGVDTTSHAAAAKHHEAEPVQAGTPRAKSAKAKAHKASKPAAHHAKAERRDSRKPSEAKKKQQDEGHRGWLPWHHKKAKEQDAKKKEHDAKKTKKHKSSSHAPITERPNGQPRQN